MPPPALCVQVWKSKAKKLVGKGSTLITTGKSGVGKAAAARETVSQRSNPALTHALLTGKQVRSPPADDINTPIKVR
ncbi:hypothetical protein DPMN_155461 [Dreissena polymorpha]|uniref:Uncharacterized protein n=1 Tax=Dreissena polymorpha TaxID=45954 RepID=A0A9D4JA00_DREPO|nr:hypothetical protein DPMN_155461 [Dreissena polymorpha]